MLASRVLITAGTPGHMYFDDKQAKWLRTRERCKKRLHISEKHSKVIKAHNDASKGVLFAGQLFKTGTYVMAW